MFVSDAHLFVPREIRWSPIMAIRFSATRRRKSMVRRLMRDVRATLPLAALASIFAITALTAEVAPLLVPTGAAQSPAAEEMQQTMARLFVPDVPTPVVAERRVTQTRPGRFTASVVPGTSVALLD